MLDENQFATKLGMTSQKCNSHMNNCSFDKLDATINGKGSKFTKARWLMMIFPLFYNSNTETIKKFLN